MSGVDDDDDLDAFFDEVEAEVEKVQDEKKEDETTTTTTTTNDNDYEPEKKKAKNTTGVVVVSKSAVTNIDTTTSSNTDTSGIYNSISTRSDHPSSITKINMTNNIMTNNNNNSMIQPPLPPGPPPSSTVSMSSSSVVTNNNNQHAAMMNNPIVPMPQTLDPNTNKKIIKRSAAGQSWEDPSLAQFPQNDYRLFVGNLAKDITDSKLAEAFQSKYPSFAMAKVIFSNQDGKSKGYGFVSLMDPKDCAKAIREMDQSWIGSRPVKVKRSEWKERSLSEVRKRKNKQRKKRNNWL